MSINTNLPMKGNKSNITSSFSPPRPSPHGCYIIEEKPDEEVTANKPT